MTTYVAQIYKDITGSEPSVPFEQRTPEEQQAARARFLATLENLHVNDDVVDEFFRAGRMTEPVFRYPDLTEDEAESA
jgi:hypothetical protein